ncbi:hypothetical protein NM208_g5144 [Fusarium decemcellulare]|uniref:Uncharacterized protein n=1 Tax=Fusarium decemcellulare TaxID=57161 RepID=A0ACC1SI41_9HYPO|nr:hypothetical protein NM208_g5144 [Fusarium decemcellulare]
MDPLNGLPVEILTDIALHLRPGDLSKLIRTCKHLSVVVTPLLWGDIETHSGSHHESYVEHDDSPPFRHPSQRSYHISPSLVHMIGTMRRLDHSRLRVVAARVKNLCLFTLFDPQIFNLLPHFTNLETFELDISCDIRMDMGPYTYKAAFESPALPKLRFAKMFGYLPYQLVKWILGSTSTLERVEVGILDRSTLTYSGFLHRGWLDPERMPDFIPSGLEVLPRLRHLHLCQPSSNESRDDDDYQGFGMNTCTWSSHAEGVSLEAWRRVLEASKQTLEILVLEQRPEIDCQDDTPWRSMMNLSSGSGSKALVDMLESTILDKEDFPVLRKVYLYGIVVRQGPDGKPMENTPGGRLMRRLEQRGVACEARFGTWTWYNYMQGSAEWVLNYKEQESDEGSDGSEQKMRWDSVLAKV